MAPKKVFWSEFHQFFSWKLRKVSLFCSDHGSSWIWMFRMFKRWLSDKIKRNKDSQSVCFQIKLEIVPCHHLWFFFQEIFSTMCLFFSPVEDDKVNISFIFFHVNDIFFLGFGSIAVRYFCSLPSLLPWNFLNLFLLLKWRNQWGRKMFLWLPSILARTITDPFYPELPFPLDFSHLGYFLNFIGFFQHYSFLIHTFNVIKP